MFKSKDFLLMEVLDTKGKRQGFIKDLILDFAGAKVKGFTLAPYKLFQHNSSVLSKNIVSFNKSMIVSEVGKGKYLQLSDIKNMDIINRSGDIIGITEDIIFDEMTFKIKGLIVSTGFVKNIVAGKKIILIDRLILGEESILYYLDNEKIKLISMPHKILMEVECHEKNI